ncbi:MAG: type III CRISPR-associated RAMP protein Csx7 [Ktedonobacteraceae bacterium]
MAQDTLTLRMALRNRYVIDGQLEMLTALHIGGGKATLSHTDSPVVLTPDGLPFIPGSSFKGTLRSTIEKLVSSLPESLGLRSCGLPIEEKDDTNEKCPTAHQKQIAKDRRDAHDPKQAAQIQTEILKNLCHTCQLFGSPYAAAHITLHDLYLLNDEWNNTTQVRDGVAIDRDSETAKDGAKYDFEVVPATTTFAMRIILENATEQDLQLISMGLSEFLHGFGGIGGLRSRGLGACILKNVQISYLDLTKGKEQERMQRLQRYLLRKELDTCGAQEFFETHINALFAGSAQEQ